MHAPAPPKLTSAFATAQQLRTERARLAGVLSRLRETDAVVAATPRAAVDPEGKLLALVLKWRAQRGAALEAEVARLDKAIEEAEAKPQTGSEAVKKLADEL
jgi:sugar (pentulose or hexulose) kinase